MKIINENEYKCKTFLNKITCIISTRITQFVNNIKFKRGKKKELICTMKMATNNWLLPFVNGASEKLGCTYVCEHCLPYYIINTIACKN